MEIIALIIIGAIVIYYINNNSRKVKDETVITTTQTTKTPTGEQVVTRTTTINDTQTDIRHPNSPMSFPDHKIVQPTQALQSTVQHTQQYINHNATPKITQQPSIQFKECSGCKRTQPISEFNKNPNQLDGFAKWCKTCMRDGAPNPTDMKGKKVCDRCRETRLKTSFYATTKYPDGLSRVCKFCMPKK